MAEWDTLVDSNLVGSGKVSAAGIYDLEGNPWAYSYGFQAKKSEIAAVAAHFAAPAGLKAATVAGVKYTYVRGSKNEEIYVKNGATGVVFCRCNTCIIVGYHNDKIQAGSCSATVKELAETLKDAGI